MSEFKDGRNVDGGSEFWFKDGKPHREDGPAIIFENGTQFWYKNGIKHRQGGPAVIRANGAVEYWSYGRKIELGDVRIKSVQ